MSARSGGVAIRCAAAAAVPVLSLALTDPGADARPPTGAIDPARSTVEVAVTRAGLLSAFGHDHRIVAPISSGVVRSEGGPGTEIVFDARSLRVEDGGLSDSDRAKVQATMEGPEVLDAARHPKVVFRSSSIEASGAGRWQVSGALTLHGETRPVRAEVSLSDRRYRGSAAIRLTDFGIRPPVVAGGAVRVRDEVQIVFDVAVEEPGG